MHGERICATRIAPRLRRGMLAVTIGMAIGAGVLGTHVSSASAHGASHNGDPAAENGGAVAPSSESFGSFQPGHIPSAGSQQPNSGTGASSSCGAGSGFSCQPIGSGPCIGAEGSCPVPSNSPCLPIGADPVIPSKSNGGGAGLFSSCPVPSNSPCLPIGADPVIPSNSNGGAGGLFSSCPAPVGAPQLG